MVRRTCYRKTVWKGFSTVSRSLLASKGWSVIMSACLENLWCTLSVPPVATTFTMRSDSPSPSEGGVEAHATHCTNGECASTYYKKLECNRQKRVLGN